MAKEKIVSDKWKFAKVDVNDIIPTKINANVMSDVMMKKFHSNVTISGLSSSITCYKNSDEKYVIISGNHRYKVALKTNMTEIFVVYADEEDLTQDEIKAIQLSHNSVHGEDDKTILKSIFDSINSIQFKDFSHVDTDNFKTESIDVPSLTAMSETYSVNLTFFKEDIDAIQEVFGIMEMEIPNNDLVLLTSEKHQQKYLDVIGLINKKYQIKSSNIAFSRLLELAQKQLENESSDSNN